MKRSDVFEVLAPPPGGLTRLRARLRERPSRWWRPVLAGALAAGVAAGVLSLHLTRPSVDVLGHARESVYAQTLWFEGQAAEPVVVPAAEDAAVLRVPTSDPSVVFYRVAMAERPGSAPPADARPGPDPR